MIRKVLILAYLLVSLGCTSLFYYPTDRLYYDPKKYFNISPEENFIPSEGLNIHSWYFNSKGDPKGVILYFHGNAENLSSHYSSLIWVLEKGYDFVIFDYPGYGRSDGHPSPAKNLNAGKEVLKWLNNKTQLPIIIYGQSLGGNVALRTAEDLKNDIPIKAIFIDSSFNSYRDITIEKMKGIWFAWPFQWVPYLTVSDKYAPHNLASLSPVPIMFIHCKDDPVVSSIYSERMYANAAEPKKVFFIESCPHGATFVVERGKYRQTFLDHIK